MASGKKPSAVRRTLHVICGTHWDREWRYSYEQSLIRLTEVIDSTIRLLEANEDFRCYHLDGGTVMLEDYTRVRPEMVERLTTLARTGRIVASPWYTLPEMFTVSGEAIIRNMMHGQRVAERFGALMRTGYTATSYGQLSQLPQLYAGFGIRDILAYRGLNKFVVPPLFWWEAPDGTRALDFRLSDDFARSNFYFRVYRRLAGNREPGDNRFDGQPGRLFHVAGAESYLDEYRLLDAEPCKFSDEAMRAAVEDLVGNAEQNSLTSGHYLAMHQEDNAVPDQDLVDLLRRIGRVCPDTAVRAESLAEYVQFVRDRMGARRLARLPVVRGEMRFADVDGFWGALHPNAISARVDLKIANESAEHALERVAEPLCAVAWCFGSDYPAERLRSAWKALLENHAHDSINGCSMDQVHKDMAYRFDKARLIGRELASRALAQLTTRMGHPGADEGDFVIGVFNASGWPRSGAVTCCVDVPAKGPSQRFELLDEAGRPVDMQVELVGDCKGRIHSPVIHGLRFAAVRHRVTFWAADLPGVGWRTYLLRPIKTVYGYEQVSRDFRSQMTSPFVMENERLRVEVERDGTFNLTDKQAARTYVGLGVMEDGGDVGSPQLYAPPPRDEVVTSRGWPCRVCVEQDGAMRTVVRLECAMRVPEEAEMDCSARSRSCVDLPITTRLILEKGARFLRLETEVDNRARDHRLRVVFPTGLEKAASVSAAAPFDVVERPLKAPDCRAWREPYSRTQPQSGFVDVSDGRNGLAIFTQGLREYEVVDVPSRPLAITLLRGMRNSMAVHAPETRGELARAGRYCLGHHVFRYAVMPHRGDWNAAQLHREFAEFRCDPEVVQFQTRQGEGTWRRACLSVRPAALVLSALKKHEDGDSLLVRLFNPTGKNIKAELEVKELGVRRAYRARLDESREQPLPMTRSGVVRFVVPHKKIVTIEFAR